MGTTKYSRQREAIIHFLKSRKDHPTAEVIYQHLKEAQPNLSLGTVYRNLTKLSTNILTGTPLPTHILSAASATALRISPCSPYISMIS